MLKKDTRNSPNHVFCDHENCSDYFCTRNNLGNNYNIIILNINNLKKYILLNKNILSE